MLAKLAVALALATLLPTAVAHPPPEGIPPAAFCIVVIEPLDGFRQVRITVDEELNSTAKLASWHLANLDGNATVTPQEAEGFRLATLEFFSGGLGMGARSLVAQPGGPYLDATAVRPVYAAAWRHLGHGFYEEAVGSHNGLDGRASVPFAAFETQAVREYGFQVPDGPSRITLAGADPRLVEGANLTSTVTYLPKPVIEYVVVRAPAGWQVERVSGFGYNGSFERTVQAASVELEGFDTSAPWSIEFLNPEQEKRLADIGSPGFETTFALAAVVAVAVAARRARMRA